MNNVVLPKELFVGLQKREDTYTGQLGYITYKDEKGQFRKKASWDSWRHSNIKPLSIINEPIEGFVLNKNVGGRKTEWGYSKTHIRIFDPRNFEFEISVENLIYILANTGIEKGGLILGELQYGWDGTDLVLIPTCAPDYKKIKEHSEKLYSIDNKVTEKDLFEGYSYITKQQGEWIFLEKIGYDFFFYNLKNENIEQVKTITGKLIYANKVVHPYFSKAYSKFIKTGLYKESKKKFKLKKNIGIRDLVKGKVYIDTNGKEYVYIDRNEKGLFFYIINDDYYKNIKSISKKFIEVKDEIVSNYEELYNNLQHLSIYSEEDIYKYCKIDISKLFDTIESKKENIDAHIYIALNLGNKNVLTLEEGDNKLWAFRLSIYKPYFPKLKEGKYKLECFKGVWESEEKNLSLKAVAMHDFSELKDLFLEKFKDYSFYKMRTFLKNGNVSIGGSFISKDNSLWENTVYNE